MSLFHQPDQPHQRSHRQTYLKLVVVPVGLALVVTMSAASAGAAPTGAPTRSAQSVAAASVPSPVPHWTAAAAHDTSAPLRTLAQSARRAGAPAPTLPAERARRTPATGFAGDGARQAAPIVGAPSTFPIANFDGLSSQDNFDVYGGRVNPPDPVGDVGPLHYVEMVNLLFAVYNKTGTRLLGPVPIGDLWAGFAIPDCTDPSGDPIVLYDQLADRWILTQFTTRGLDDPTLPFYNCVAVSTTGDPTGSYHRYAFTTGFNFPDYPKYGVWTNTYTITTREFGPTTEYGIGVYALEKAKMLQGLPARAASFFVDGNDPQLLPLVGDGLLPADIDGTRLPPDGRAIPLVGTQDDDFGYGATRDALNVWNLRVRWTTQGSASMTFARQLPVAEFDSAFPCGPDSRDCLPQPGINNPAQFLDILSSRQRPTWRLAYRNFGTYESLVTNQSVEAAPSVAGVRWYELRRTDAGYRLHQQGTYAPADGINRWMGSIAQDKRGNMGLGYSVVNGTNVFPGIRFTGRFKGDPLGKMTLHEGVIRPGTGVQTSTNSRWGDYTSMNVDPVDDCTLWYVNEYYSAAGQASSPVGWQTRIASFKMPGC
jgi:hypothetical protein